MPSAPNQAGVQIEEAYDRVPTIEGLATSVTAFVGRTPQGPGGDDPGGPVRLESFPDYERTFGVLDGAYPLGYAVRDFFLNGGTHAIVVRVYQARPDRPARARIPISPLVLEAASAGAWANHVRARIDHDVSSAVAADPDAATEDRFNLTLRNVATGSQQVFPSLTIRDGPRRIDRVLRAEAAWMRIPAWPAAATTRRPQAHAEPPPGLDPWHDDACSSGVPADALAVDSQAPLDAAALIGNATAATGLHALARIDLFNLLCIPPEHRLGDTDPAVYAAALTVCVQRRALLLVDPPAAWSHAPDVAGNADRALADLGLHGDATRNAALYFPRIIAPDPARDDRLDAFVPCGAVAGVIARTDARLGVWGAPAGPDASLRGVGGLTAAATTAEQGALDTAGINCLRILPGRGPVVWGVRTLNCADRALAEHTWLPVRRLALHLEECLTRGLRWVAFEANDERLWERIRLSVVAFMADLYRRGAFQGRSERDAYFVKCDQETTNRSDVALGVVNTLVGFAPLKPAEFMLIRLQQATAQASA